MAEVTWLGDDDPQAQVIEQYGHRFVKGEAVKVDDNDPTLGKLRANAAFSLKKAEPVQSTEPEPVDPDAGTEIASVRKALDERGVKYDGRSSLDNLRAKLASEEAKDAK